MLTSLISTFKQGITYWMQRAQQVIQRWLTPQPSAQGAGIAQDLVRSRQDLIAANALLRQQLIVIARQVKRPRFTSWDRWLMVWLASLTRTWHESLLLIQPDTLLRWHRKLLKWVWRAKSQHTGGKAPLDKKVIQLIRQFATENPLWGAERIRGELLKLGFTLSKSTVQKYLSKKRTTPVGQTWQTFLHNHREQIWACDFIQVTDVLFRSLFAFVIVELGSRRMVHVGVTRHPTDAWVAQQIREAISFGEGPRFLLRDNDRKYGSHVWAVTTGAGIEVLKTLIGAPKANAICERFIGSARRECFDHVLIFNERHLGC